MGHSADILIVTVNSEETKAVIKAFEAEIGKPATLFNDGNHTYHDFGALRGQHLVMVQSEMGIAGIGASQQTVSEGISSLHPTAVIMVGIAFGLNPEKQNIGQILVAKQCLYYEPQRVSVKDDKEVLIPRGSRVDVSPKLLSCFKAVAARLEESAPKVSFGLIVSGEKLVDNPEFAKKLLEMEPEAIGGEMEGAGLYSACQSAHVDWILVKAICDWGDGNKNNPNKNKDQKLAASNAAAFVVHALKAVDLIDKEGVSLTELDAKMSATLPTSGLIAWPPQIPNHEPEIANRGEEFKFFSEMISGGTKERAMFIEAASNRGKTTLLMEFVKYTKKALGATSCVIVDFKLNPTKEVTLDTLRIKLGGLLPNFRKFDSPPRALRTDLRSLSTPTLLLFDTFEKASAETRDLVTGQLLADIEDCAALRIVIAGQSVPDSGGAYWNTLVRQFSIGNITDHRQWSVFFKRRYGDPDDSEISLLTEVTKGDPGVLRMYLDTLGARPKSK